MQVWVYQNVTVILTMNRIIMVLVKLHGCAGSTTYDVYGQQKQNIS